MASSSSIFRELNMSVEAIKKREYRVIEKEKKRRNGFIEGYMRIKYPKQYHEANAMYEELSTRYPNKLDLTKSYYFQKWVMQFKKSENTMLIPHLPILMSVDLLNQSNPKSIINSKYNNPKPIINLKYNNPKPIINLKYNNPKSIINSKYNNPKSNINPKYNNPKPIINLKYNNPKSIINPKYTNPNSKSQRYNKTLRSKPPPRLT